MTEQDLDLGLNYELSQYTDRHLLEQIHEMLTTLTTAKQIKRKPSRVEYSGNFEIVWANYPDRSGSNPKKTAYEAWCKRIEEGHDMDVILRGVDRYVKWCEANQRVGTEYVMQAARFFGPSLEFANAWAVEAKSIDWQRQDDNALLRACAERNISTHGLTRFQIIDRLQNA